MSLRRWKRDRYLQNLMGVMTRICLSTKPRTSFLVSKIESMTYQRGGGIGYFLGGPPRFLFNFWFFWGPPGPPNLKGAPIFLRGAPKWGAPKNILGGPQNLAFYNKFIIESKLQNLDVSINLHTLTPSLDFPQSWDSYIQLQKWFTNRALDPKSNTGSFLEFNMLKYLLKKKQYKYNITFT